MSTYDLRSNIKNKPGAQGTLFKVNDKSTYSDRRWPQGYTPERLNDVRDALKDTRFKTFSPGLGSAPIRKWEDLDRDHFARTVAPSSLPANDLRGLTKVDTKITSGSKDTEAEYRPGMREIGWDLGRADHAKNLVHEIGHHVENMRQDLPPIQPGQIQRHAEAHVAAKGKTRAPNSSELANIARTVDINMGEGYADNYHVQHYRSPGRNGQRATQGRYEEIHGTWAMSHAPGYYDVRTPPPAQHLGPQFTGMNKIEHIVNTSLGHEDESGQTALFPESQVR